jgi:hypothetical protein
MSAIKLSTPSSGSISLSPADTASNLTITVPAVSGTMLTNKTAGTVLQVVNVTYGSATSTGSTSRSDTGLSASITPSSSSSKILVFVNMAGCSKNSGTSTGPYMAFWLMRNSTDIIKFEGEVGYTGNTNANSTGACSTAYLDSPATTSSTTYKVQFNNGAATGGTVAFNSSSSVSTITLMEIAA